MFPVKITTERLILREYEVADAPTRFAYFSDPEVMRYQTLAVMPTLESAVSRVTDNYRHAQGAQRREYVFAITFADQVIGECGLLLNDEKDRSADIFFTLAHHAWGNGYASDAAIATAQFGFETLRLHRIAATVHPDNAASIAIVTRKLGMQLEGTQRESQMGMQGEMFDMSMYATLETDAHPWVGPH